LAATRINSEVTGVQELLLPLLLDYGLEIKKTESGRQQTKAQLSPASPMDGRAQVHFSRPEVHVWTWKAPAAARQN
jgi:hypothetical protein